MSTQAFRSDIQGLRAVAVLAVVLYHAFQKAVPGGFVGVDIFFVISGFVITRSIDKDMENGTFSIANFYRRRIRRIFPALYLMLATVLALSYFLFSPNDLKELGKTAFGTSIFSSNIVFLHLTGYFDGNAELKPLLHTWSLSVEEQFYIFYPLIFFLVRRFRNDLLLPGMVAGAVLSLALSQGVLSHHQFWAFYMAPPRAFELLLGCIAARAPAPLGLNHRLRGALAVGALLLMVAPIGLYGQPMAFPGIAALPPCLGAALIIWTGLAGENPAGRLLSLPPLMFFGNISYSLYLWHWPSLVLARHFFGWQLAPATSLICLAIAVLAAWLSFRFVEQPLLAGRNNRLPFLPAGLVVGTGFAALGLVIFLEQGLPNRFTPAAQALFAAADDYNHRRSECHNFEQRRIPFEENCVFGATGAKADVAIWGDSHGAEVAMVLGDELKRSGRAAMEITASACPPALGFQLPERPECLAHNDETLARLTSDRNIATVVLIANFLRYAPELDAVFAGYEKSVAKLVSAGKKVVVVYPIPVFDFDPPTMLGMRERMGWSLAAVGMDASRYQADNGSYIRFLDGLVEKYGLAAIRPGDLYCGSGRCATYSATNGVLYFNGDHLSLTGARPLAQAIAAELPRT